MFYNAIVKDYHFRKQTMSQVVHSIIGAVRRLKKPHMIYP